MARAPLGDASASLPPGSKHFTYVMICTRYSVSATCTLWFYFLFCSVHATSIARLSIRSGCSAPFSWKMWLWFRCLVDTSHCGGIPGTYNWWETPEHAGGITDPIWPGNVSGFPWKCWRTLLYEVRRRDIWTTCLACCHRVLHQDEWWELDGCNHQSIWQQDQCGQRDTVSHILLEKRNRANRNLSVKISAS